MSQYASKPKQIVAYIVWKHTRQIANFKTFEEAVDEVEQRIGPIGTELEIDTDPTVNRSWECYKIGNDNIDTPYSIVEVSQ